MSLRALFAAPALVAALVAVAVLPAPARAAIPNRLYGTAMLNGAPAPIGTSVVAYVGDKVCASTTVSRLAVDTAAPAYPYKLDVPQLPAPQECQAGAVLTFKIGGVTAGQTFTLDDIGSNQRLDLTAPGIPVLPSTTRTVTLTTGCNNFPSTWADNTPASTVAAAVSPTTALTAIWRYDAATRKFLGYTPAAAAVSDLTTVNHLDALIACVTTGATLAEPSV